MLSPIFYYFVDQVGSTRTITTGSGTGQTPGQLCYDADFTPYGQEISYPGRLQTTACPPNYRFTGYEYDSETGLHYAFARYYSARLGRFLSTDPLGGSIGNLQSHNAYAYTGNNPLNLVDPKGTNDCEEHADCGDSWWTGPQPGQDLFGGSLFGQCWFDIWGGDCAAIWKMLDPSGRHQSQLLEDYARYQSILNTGWDPELQRWEWNWHSLETDLAMAMANPGCSSLLGGSDVGPDLATNMAFTDPGTAAAIVNLTNPAPSPLDPGYIDWYVSQLAPLQRVARGQNYALTLITPDGQVLGYVTGPSFAGLSIGRQMTVMIHEFNHATGNPGELSPGAIAQACGTTVP